MATVKQQLSIGDAIYHATAQPTLVKDDGTNFPVWGLSFSNAATQQASWRFKASNYGASNPNLVIVIDWYSSATSGTASFRGKVSVLTPGDAQSMLLDAFATAVTGTTVVNTTANGLNRTTITITSANLDSMTADDSVELCIDRNDASVAAACKVVGIELQYSDT